MVDGIILFFLFVMFIAGFSRGALRQLWSLAVLVLATYMSGVFYLSLSGVLHRYIPDPVSANLVSCVVIFGVVSSALNLVADIIAHVRPEDEGKKPGFVDRSIGSVLGIVEALGFVEVAAAVIVAFPVLGLDRWVAMSSLLGAIFNHVPVIMPLLPAAFQQVLPFFQ